MSANVTLCEITEGEWLESRGDDDSVWLCGPLIACSVEYVPPHIGVSVRLSRDAVEAIARLYQERAFLHQWSQIANKSGT